MTAEFDPYHRWLGIHPSEQPVNLYRLLGLNLFESDPYVIDTAANGRILLLRSLQLGQHSDLHQKLLNEVAAARICLLKPEQRAAYDAELRARIAHKRQSAAAPIVPVAKAISLQSLPDAQVPPTKPASPAIQPLPAILPAAGIRPAAGHTPVARLISLNKQQPPSDAASPASRPAPEATVEPAMPAPARPGGRRMLPLPRKAAPESPSDAADETSGEADFFSTLAEITAPSAAAGPGAAHAGSTAARKKGRRPARQNHKMLWIAAGGIAAVAVAMVGAFALLGNNNGTSPAVPAVTNSGLPSHLVFDWPESQRLGARLEIDGVPREIPASGAIDFELPAGTHRIALRRLGNAQIDNTVDLKQDERYRFTPEWKTVEPTNQTAAAGRLGDSDMLVTDALPELKHWSTDFEAAKRKAARDDKDLFLVFFGPDKRQWCLQLAADLLLNNEFRRFVDPRFELVLLEEPPVAASSPAASSSKATGKGAVETAEIAKLAAEYNVTSFPTIVLADAEGTAFDREEYKQVSLIDYLKSFAGGLAIRKERDKIFAPTETGSDIERLAAARQALDWLEKNDLASLYTAKIHGWLELAEKVDPNNEHGQCEAFFLAEVRERLESAGKDDPQKILAASRPLEDWQKAGRKFKNGDLAARDYLSVAGMLFNAGDPQEAVAYIEGAYNCNPSDPRLKAYLGQLHELMTSPVSFGSGFVFAPGGYVLTNNHVIAGEGKIFVRVPGDKKEIPADLVGASAQLDVAVLKMRGDIPTLKPLPLATTTLPRGTEVVAFGYPLGQADMKLTQGPVSAPPSEQERFYVLDMRVNPGNSGGPLVDMRGEVVGIVSAKTVARDEKEDSYGLAIPGETVAGFIKHLAPSIPDYHPLSADESAKLPELDKLTKVDAIVSQAVVQIVKRRE